MLRVKGEGDVIGSELFAWRTLFPLGMKPPWLYGTGAKVELESGLLYGKDTCAALARWFKPLLLAYVQDVALRVQLRHLGLSSSHCYSKEDEQGWC